jgi:prefoldin subunit 5
MSTYQDEINSLTAQIAEIQTAISSILAGGQSFSIGSGSTSRSVTQADLKTLIAEKNNLQARLAELRGSAGMVINPGW